MEPNDSERTLNAAELEFMDYMQHGDDFLKIELLRPAISWYRKALILNIDNVKVQERIAKCEKMLDYERRVAIILGIVAIALILIFSFFIK